MSLHKSLEEAGVDLIHHFSSGVYIKQTNIPAGEELLQHKHKHDHLSVLCKGWAVVTVDGVSKEVRGPKVLTIEAGKSHAVKALTSIIWLCIHATDEIDPILVDAAVIEDSKG